MRKDTKLAIGISTTLILVGIFIFLWILPFLYVYIGILDFGSTNVQNTKWDKMAVRYSIFPAQKIYTIESALPGLIVNKEYDTAIEYVEELEKLSSAEPNIKYLAAYAYIQKEDYQKALKYAKESNNKGQLAQVYINLKDYKSAKKLVDEMFEQKQVSPRAYIYKAQIEIIENNWTGADKSINKLLIVAPNNREALKIKAKIAHHTGNNTEHKKCIKKLKLIELKNSTRIVGE